MLRAHNIVDTSVLQVVSNGFSVEGYSSSGGVLSYAMLTGEEVPEHVDPAKKEEYLSDAEFAQFCSMPAWKQIALKRSKSLF